ncbi:hypothetical protein EVAR_11416_1 [Eumeta japonica]|uniref:Uncharacterized protein n=1 Tax=Eumeta variegata TaxID=151549 RepID=A0A4C1TKS9_EUMVA|nr:hypothetical protein EVAR_11416_1 [Eumeta japonica]
MLRNVQPNETNVSREERHLIHIRRVLLTPEKTSALPASWLEYLREGGFLESECYDGGASGPLQQAYSDKIVCTGSASTSRPSKLNENFRIVPHHIEAVRRSRGFASDRKQVIGARGHCIVEICR